MTGVALDSVTGLRKALRRGEVSAAEATAASLDAAAANASLNAFITLTPEHAIAAAQDADRRLAQGDADSLCGIPVAVKDMFCTRGIRTTAGSRMLADFVPTYESTVTRRAWDQGAVLVGKTNQDEFAMGSSNLTSAFGPVVSPVRGPAGEALVPGGSSGGSAAAVAAGIVPAALGTDTGGSVRQPASLCGIVGLKPTYGLCSRWGIVAYGSSFDQAGVLTRSVEDAAVMLDAVAGWDPRDATSVKRTPVDHEAALAAPVAGMTVGVPREFRIDGLAPDVLRNWDRAIAVLEAVGVRVVEMSLPLSKAALACYYVLVCAEASSNLARFDGVRYGRKGDGRGYDAMISTSRAAGFGPEVIRRILSGTHALSAGHYDRYFGQGVRVRTLLQAEFRNAAAGIDALLFPTSPIPAFPIDRPMPADPTSMYLIDVYTVTANVLGVPGISIPFGLSDDGLPLGMQLMGHWFGEPEILRLGDALFRARTTRPTDPLRPRD